MSEQLAVSVVPTFVFFRGKRIVDRLEGADAAELTRRVQRLVPAPGATTAATTATAGVPFAPLEDLRARLEGLVSSTPVILFMKGTPDAPRCGFSRRAVEMLKETGTTFGSFGECEVATLLHAPAPPPRWRRAAQIFWGHRRYGRVSRISSPGLPSPSYM